MVIDINPTSATTGFQKKIIRSFSVSHHGSFQLQLKKNGQRAAILRETTEGSVYAYRRSSRTATVLSILIAGLILALIVIALFVY
jgi:hypothetical protein